MSYALAIADFAEARQRAFMEQIIARLRGRSPALLSFEEVREKLKAKAAAPPVLKEIPLDAIVGSVGRYTDFTRSFLPLEGAGEERWARVKEAVTSLGGLPPIDVYQVGDAYFVRDGNHRVSVARELEAPTIQAYVTKVETRVPLSPDDQPDDLILKAEQAEFLERTDLDKLRPDSDLTVTAPGRYRTLLEHIEVHRYFMGLDRQSEIPYREAVVHWHDQVYQPVIEAIRQRGVLVDFPGRTETDLYVWVSERRAALEEALGWRIETEQVAADLARQHGSRPARVLARLGERLRDALLPDELQAGPAPGQWREERVAPRREDRLFCEIMVLVGCDPARWPSLDQAVEIARREGGYLRGLHLVPRGVATSGAEAQRLVAAYERRCQAAGVAGHLVVETGRVADRASQRARWSDLVVVKVTYPPGPRLTARLSSGFRRLLLRCPRPILAVPGEPSPLTHALLAYDDSPKAREALYVAAYLACRWQLPLTVFSGVEVGRVTAAALDEARRYLEERGVAAGYVDLAGRRPEVGSDLSGLTTGEALLRVAEGRGCDLILMGGYGHGPVTEAIVGSTVDHTLRESRWPVLVCR